MIIEFSDTLSQSMEDNMSDGDALNNYVTCVLDAKDEQVISTKVATPQK